MPNIDSILKDYYDVIVIGGGPAGTSAAKFASKNGAKTILFERDKVIGAPVRCGEGVSKRGIANFVPLKGPWIVNELKKVRLIAPDNRSVELESSLVGYILDRTVFDKYLAEKAEQSGARIVTQADVTNLIFKNNKPAGVEVKITGKTSDVFGKVIIGADGVEARTGRWAGLKTLTKLSDMETGIQVRATNLNIDPTECVLYFGRKIAPGGYAWVFPKNANEANIGLAIAGNFNKEKPAEEYLDNFLEKCFPNALFDVKVAGGVSCNPPLKSMVSGNVMVAGDSGHVVNPLTGAGIANALQSGKLAGETAAEAISNPDDLENILQKYTKRWYKSRGKNHKQFTRLKNFVQRLDDKQFNDIAVLMQKLPKSDWNLLKIFMLAVRNHPDLIIDAVRVFRKM